MGLERTHPETVLYRLLLRNIPVQGARWDGVAPRGSFPAPLHPVGLGSYRVREALAKLPPKTHSITN